jgi:hypothetical protein
MVVRLYVILSTGINKHNSLFTMKIPSVVTFALFLTCSFAYKNKYIHSCPTITYPTLPPTPVHSPKEPQTNKSCP